MAVAELPNGLRMHYRDQGQGDPLVLLHGLGSSGLDWEHQIPAFAEHYQVIAPDLRGSGDSDKPRGPYKVGQFADDVWQLLDTLGIPSARLVGLSMGGATAFEMAARQPDRVRALVVVNCPPDFSITSLRKLLEVAMRLVVVQCLGMQRMATMIGDRLFPDADQAELRETFVQRYGANRKREYLWSLRSLPGWSVTDRLGRIDCPALMVAAANDYTPVAEKQVAVDALPRGEMAVVDNSRHATPIDSPDRFNSLVLDFLQRQGA